MDEPWKKDGVRDGDDWSSLIFVRVLPDLTNILLEDTRSYIPLGYVFVIEEKEKWKDYVAQWKLPGGHKERGENPLFTARRELLGETYISPEDATFRYLTSVWKNKRGSEHWKCYFLADVRFSQAKVMCEYHPGNEGERPEFFDRTKWRTALADGKFLREHYQVLLDATAILPLDVAELA